MMLRLLPLLFLLLLLPQRGEAQQEDEIVADVSSRHIAVTAGFNGATTTLFGALPREGEVIIVVTGPLSDVIVRRKERYMGLWLNRSSASFHAVPGFYWVASSKPLADMASSEFLSEKRIGIEHLRFTIAEASNLQESALFQKALVEIKTQEEDYSARPAMVSIMGGRLYRADLSLPSGAPTGEYLITTYLLRSGRLLEVQQTPLVLRKEGAMAAVSAIAVRHSLFYALGAVFLALFSGWLSAALMQRR